MLDFQTFGVSARLVLAMDHGLSGQDLSRVIRTALQGLGMTAGPAKSDPTGAIRIAAAGLHLLVSPHAAADGRPALALVLTGDPFGDADTPARHLAKLLAPLLRALPVAEVEWQDNGLCIPAERMRAALAAAQRTAAPITCTPRRVTRAARTTLTARPDARTVAVMQARIDDAAVTTAAPAPLRPRRVTAAQTPGTRQRLSANLAQALGRMLAPGLGGAERRDAAAQDAHVQAYHRHLSAALADCLDRADTAPEASTETRVTTWAVSLVVAAISWPMALPVIAYNLTHGADLRAAALVLGLAGPASLLGQPGLLTGLMTGLLTGL